MASVFTKAGDLFIEAELLIGCEAEVKALRAKIGANAKAAADKDAREIAKKAKAAMPHAAVVEHATPKGKVA